MNTFNYPQKSQTKGLGFLFIQIFIEADGNKS